MRVRARLFARACAVTITSLSHPCAQVCVVETINPLIVCIMKKKFPAVPDSKWIYFVYNWGSPIGVFTNVVLAVALFKRYYDRWGNPPEGALTVVRYKPAVDFYKHTQQDITSSILKMVCND